MLTLFGYILSPEVPGVPIWLSQVSRSFCLAIFPLIAYLGYREKRLTLELVKSTRLAAEHTALQEKSQWLQKTAAEVQDLYDHAPCGYHSLDSTGLIVAINQTESDWLGYSKEELIGQKRFTEFFTPAGIRLFKEEFPKVITDGDVKDVEFELIRKDGSTLLVLLNASALTDSEGRFIASRSTLIDITEWKRVDQALRDSHQSLEALVAERTTALQASNQRLEQELAQSQQIQQALTASEYRFRELVKSLPLPIWTCLPDGTCDYLDFIFSYQVFKHVPSVVVIENYLKEIKRTLQVGGVAKLHFRTGSDVYRWRWFYGPTFLPAEAEKMATDAGLTIVETTVESPKSMWLLLKRPN